MAEINFQSHSKVTLATKTMELIAHYLNADQCGQFRQHLKDLMPQMDDAYRGSESKYRSHQGASGIGNECEREIQLKWHWTVQAKFDHRILRLFNRGHLEEARFLAILKCLPEVNLWYVTEDGGQFKFSDHGGHYGSALDGIATGIPDVPMGAPVYTEFKTASDSKFNGFVKNGVRKENFTYYVQCQQCMKYYNLGYTLFMVVNKNTDELYAEILTYDQEIADKYSERAGKIIFSTEALPRISNHSTFWKCRFCDVKAICHGKDVPDVNCRTCSHWSPLPDGSYSCARGNNAVVSNSELSWEGCDQHVFNPTLLSSYEFVGGSDKGNYSILKHPRGMEFKQGPDYVTSYELKIIGTKYAG